ncbi:hypothetical protein, partial [Burkholderia pseudomallei]|uniref:hypothetical protein n=1 Tax=Burkholderia pseudomallei TaxID=28450 RepID=UPI0020D0B636
LIHTNLLIQVDVVSAARLCGVSPRFGKPLRAPDSLAVATNRSGCRKHGFMIRRSAPEKLTSVNVVPRGARIPAFRQVSSASMKRA